MELIETGSMKREARILNLLCIVVALVFVGLAILNAVLSYSFISTDNLFVTVVCLVMALLFAVNPVLYLKDEGRLPIPKFLKSKTASARVAPAGSARALPPSAPLLDAKGRAVPPDVKSMVNRMKEPQS
jgi:hypothetical protein